MYIWCVQWIFCLSGCVENSSDSSHLSLLCSAENLRKFCLHEENVKFKTQPVKWIKILPMFLYTSRAIKLMIMVGKVYKNFSSQLRLVCVSIVRILLWHIIKVVYDYFYQLKCPHCNKKYVRHIEIWIYERYKKHFRDFETGSNKSNFIGHLLDNHSVSIVEDMGVLNIIKKGELLTLEKFHIYT